MAGPSMRQYAGRAVWVHLPPGYDDTRPDPYPVFVLHDAQNLFASRPGAIGGSWRADEAFDRLAGAGRMIPTVLLGIDHAGEGRIAEFAPPALGRRGGARDYADFVIEEALPALAREAHVRLDADAVGIGGSSMGGLVSLWMAATRPGRFRRVIAMSPSVWWNRRSILRVLKRQPIDPSTRVWVDAGVREGARVTRDARAVADVLLSQGAPHVRYVEDPDGEHAESSWARRLPEALAWVSAPASASAPAGGGAAVAADAAGTAGDVSLFHSPGAPGDRFTSG